MRHRLLAFASPAILAAIVPAQIPSLPAASRPRYVDFSRDLDRPGALVVIGTLGRCKEGRRERLPDGSLGGSTTSVAVSGTQYFKVQVQAPVQVRTPLYGRPGERLQVGFDVQLARLPDGRERRQLLDGAGSRVENDMLALFVLAPRPKGKDLELLHLIPFDAAQFPGPDGETGFVDAMHDFTAINQRVHDLTAAIAAVDQAEAGEQQRQARAALQRLLEQEIELRRPEHEALLRQHTAPLEQRAKKRLGDGKTTGGGDGG